MILKMRVPAPDATFRAFKAGFVAKWHKQEGDTVAFGDDICDVAIDEFVALQRTKRATLLGSTSRLRKRKVKDGYDLREGRGEVRFRLTSAERSGTLSRIMIPEGGRIEIGSLIGVFSDEGRPDDAAIEAAAEARIVANIPDPEDFDPFDD